MFPASLRPASRSRPASANSLLDPASLPRDLPPDVSSHPEHRRGVCRLSGSAIARIKTRVRSCGAPTSAEVNNPISTSKPSLRRSRQTRFAPPVESIPWTFSMRTNHVPDWTMMRRVSDHRSRSSSAPSRFPATECGWHGIPPMRPSTRPRHGRPLKVRTSLHTGAGAMRPLSIAETRRATANASLSTSTIERAFGIATSTPKSSPPPPVQSEMMLSAGRGATFIQSPRRCARRRLAFDRH